MCLLILCLIIMVGVFFGLLIKFPLPVKQAILDETAEIKKLVEAIISQRRDKNIEQLRWENEICKKCYDINAVSVMHRFKEGGKTEEARKCPACGHVWRETKPKDYSIIEAEALDELFFKMFNYFLKAENGYPANAGQSNDPLRQFHAKAIRHFLQTEFLSADSYILQQLREASLSDIREYSGK